jgi:hypothetical protein
MTYRAGFGKSFGTIGFSSNMDMNLVWNNNWMCNSTSTPGDAVACGKNLVTAGTGDSTATPNKLIAAVTALNVSGTANSAQFITVISLWSLGMELSSANSAVTNAAVWSNLSSLKLTF